jgi:hypothetical protein
MRKLALVLLLLGAIGASADNWNKTYSVAGRPGLQVNTDDGQIRVTTWDQPQIEAVVRTSGWKIGPGGVTIRESQSGNRVSLDVRTPHMTISFWPHSLEIEVKVPREANLDFHTGDGSIHLDHVKGNLKLDTGDGAIEGGFLDGNLYAHTGDGHIDLDGRFDQVDVKSGDGKVEVEARAGSKPSSAWTLHSGDGRIRLALPQDINADLYVHTGDGHIDVGIPVTAQGQSSSTTVRGKINAGGPQIEVTTGDGSITIERS